MVSKASSSRHDHHNAVDRIVESRSGVGGCGVMGPLKRVPPCNGQGADLVCGVRQRV